MPPSFESRSSPLGTFLRSFDVYRKIPKDLTQSTSIGGFVSIFAFFALMLLLYLQVNVMFSSTVSTSIVIDHSEDDSFRVNFNMTIPGLSCEFLAVDLKNVIGKNREDIHDNTIHKYAVDGTWVGFASKSNIHEDHKKIAEGKTSDVSAADLNAVQSMIPSKDHYGNERHSLELHAGSFGKDIDQWELLMVDFHAPWCIHCRNLSPIWEKAAELVQRKAMSAEHGLDAHHRHSLALGSIDCTRAENFKLCRDNHIQGFPTILVYRQGKNRMLEGKHESYHGEL